MEFLGRQLEAFLGSTAESQPPPPPTLTRIPLRRASSEPAEEGREASMLFTTDWEDLSQSHLYQPSTSLEQSTAGRRSRLMPQLRGLWSSPDPDESEKEGSVSDDDKPSVKGRIKRYLTNVRYGFHWPRKPPLDWDGDDPIWLLGKFYHARTLVSEPASPTVTDAELLTPVESVIMDFYRDFSSRIWLTYRKGFPALERSSSRTDAGWGCMIRSVQMMMAQALVLHLLGREWTLYDTQTTDTIRCHRRIVAFFGDSPACPLSIHNIVEEGARQQSKVVGDWYGPSSVALAMRDLFRTAVVTSDPILSQLAIYVARDCAVYVDEVEELCCQIPENGFKRSQTPPPAAKYAFSDPPLSSFVRVEKLIQPEAYRCEDEEAEEPREWSRSLVLIVPLRLGTQHLNPSYTYHLRTLLSLRNCLGLIGGRPKHSLYIVGCHKDNLIYLDPHLSQEYEDTSQLGFAIQSFHCQQPRQLPLHELDPSLAVGFYARNRAEYHQLLDDLTQVIEREESGRLAGRQPLFSILNRPPVPHQESENGSDHASAALHHGFELL